MCINKGISKLHAVQMRNSRHFRPTFVSLLLAMKQNKILVVFALLILSCALYRIVPGRPYGFAPQIAVALFGGAILKDKKWAFALPLFSMFISDALYEAFYRMNLGNMPGFYEGQGVNYLLLAGVCFLGMAVRKVNFRNVAIVSVAAPVVFFLLSNLATWLGHGGYNLPMTTEGLYQTYVLALPFFYMSMLSTILFSAVFFGIWHRIEAPKTTVKSVAA